MSYRVDQHHDTSFDEDEALHPSPGLDRNPFARDGTYFESDSQEDSEATGSGDNGRSLEPIAIIGLATKFPGDAVNSEAFWETLVKKRSALSKVPKERYNADAFDGPSQGHFIRENLGAFDAAFFTVSPTEAENMDPQQRWLLETSYHALENAGISLDQATGSQTSVHVGCFTHDFEKMVQADVDLPGRHKVLGSSKSILANRVSWFYDLHGPSVVVDTACSSSLVALHEACQDLRSGSADMGIVAGVNIFFDPAGTMNMSNLGFLSPEGKCYSFDHRANGYSRGEGVGVVIIKPLSDAIRDGNCIRAVIRATGSNQDGRTPGITQPSGSAQEQLIRNTYRKANLNMAATRYFEAHGTGTPVGDPIEAKAIANAFKDPHREPLYVGAVKSNVGHLEGASGIAGLIKTVLVLERGVIPANIWFERVNPKIDAKAWNLVFPTETIPWPSTGLRRASVNSFGFGGTNAHAVLDDAYHYLASRGLDGRHCTKYQRSGLSNGQLQPGIDVNVRPEEEITRILALSAFDEAGINRLTSTLLGSQMARGNDMSLEDVAYTVNEKRTKLSWRSFAIATSQKPFFELMFSDPVRATNENRLCLVFTGQGAQWRHMGEGLLRFGVFNKAIDDAQNFISSLGCYWSIKEALYMKYKPEDGYSDINLARFSQPLCTIIQVAVVDLLASWNIKPAVVVGHSSGEIAAAYCSGSISRETAWSVSYYRGLAISQAFRDQPSGFSMMAVQLSADRLAPHLSPWNYSCTEKDRITIACYNSPYNVTVSGPIQGLESLGSSLERHGVLFRRLKVDVGYHSQQMNEAAELYRQYLGSNWPTRESKAGPLFVSTVTGSQVTSHELQTPEYWVSNLLNPVRFSDVMSSILSSARHYILEIGPHSTLRSPIRDVLKSLGKDIGTCYSSVLVRNHDAFDTVLDCVGKMYCSGQDIDLAIINGDLGKTKTPHMLTDLAPYPFNHTQNYWVESRLDQLFRFRKAGRHELLGTPVSDWNELEARWNNRLIMKDMEFLNDHKVNGLTVYPAAGMLVMVLEAVQQLLPTKKTVSGYRFKNVAIQSAIVLEQNPQGAEAQLTLRPCSETAVNPLSKWNEFRICVYENKTWRECCTGSVIVEYDESAWSPSGIAETEQQHAVYNSSVREAEGKCGISLDKTTVYNALEKIGLGYGPTFQGLRNIRVDNHGSAVGVVDLQHWMSVDTQGKCKPHLIHPTALDGMLQLAFPALAGSALESIPTMVPTCISNIWISKDVNKSAEHRQLNTCATSKMTGLREVQSSLVASDVSSGQVLVTVDASMTVVGSARSAESEDRDISRRLYRVDYHPDVALLNDPKQLDASGNLRSIPDEAVSEMDAEKELLCLAAIETAIHDLPPSYTAPTPHLQRYVEWMKRQRSPDKEYPESCTVPKDCSERDQHHLQSRVGDLDAEGAILAKIAQTLPNLLNGEVDPLEFLFSDDLLEQFYRECQWTVGMKDQIQAFVGAMAHKTPGLRVLEVGAGTGGMTSAMVDALGFGVHHGSAAGLLQEYIYTDISPGFFVQAREKFPDPRIQFKILDISSNPSSQGFETGIFDIITASNVLHATPDIEETLRNCRSLLKPGGKLILHEIMNPDSIKMGMIFGLLPGWWLSKEEHRQWSPLMSRAKWDGSLAKTGFSGADLMLEGVYAEPSETPALAVLVSTAIPATPHAQPTLETAPTVTVIYDESSKAQCEILEQLQHQHAASRINAKLDYVNMSSALTTVFENSTCVFLPDFDRPMLQNLSSPDLSLIKKICSEADRMIWACTESTNPAASPSHGLAKGLARTVESENLDFGFVTITLDASCSSAHVADHVWKVFLKNSRRAEEGYENEYVERNGVLCIPRLVEAPETTSQVYPDVDAPQLVSRKWNDEKGKPLKLVAQTVGLLDSLGFEEFEMDSAALASNEVQVHVQAVGLNFKDVLTALGQVNDNYLGNELAGVVTGLGSPNTSNLEIGDVVIGVHTGTMATTVRCKAYQLHKLPANIPLLTGAALPLVYCTAYYSLVTWARAQPGESILIHSGAGGVGQAAIQLSKILGLEIFTTTSSDEKVQLLMDLYDIPKSHIFSSRSLDFAQGVKRMTGNSGVDIVLNSLSGEALRKSWEVLAPFGRFIELGKKDIHSTGNSASGTLPMQQFANNVMFASVDLPSLYKTRDRITDVLSAVVKLAAEGSITPPDPVQVFRGSEIQQAFRLMQTGKHTGKLVIEFADEDAVDVKKLRRTQVFDENSTYIIAGGLGGIARSICKWMVQKGAKHIALLSRSGVRDTETQCFLDDLQSTGTEIAAHACDVSDPDRLRTVLDSIESTMPPIKGCIQAAMVLQNMTFNNMSVEAWAAAIRPKVDGSWNLHTLLPKGMDFFLLLSSHSGLLGAHGQSNYAAGNVFQDELARYRATQGEKATSIDLGSMSAIGYVAKNTDVIAQALKQGLEDFSEQELLSLLEVYCDRDLPMLNASDARIVTPVGIPAVLEANGITEPSWMSKPVFKHLHQISIAGQTASAEAKPTRSWEALLREAKTVPDAESTVREAIQKQLAGLLAIGMDDVDTSKPVHSYGVDSLVAIELRNWFVRSIGADVAVFEILGNSTIANLARDVAGKSRFVDVPKE